MGSKQALKYGKVTVADLLETEASRARLFFKFCAFGILGSCTTHYPLVLEAVVHYGR